MPDLCVAIIVTFITLLLINWLAPMATKCSVSDSCEEIFFNRQRKRILAGIVGLDVVFIILELKEYWSLIMYTMLVILISMILGLRKRSENSKTTTF